MKTILFAMCLMFVLSGCVCVWKPCIVITKDDTNVHVDTFGKPDLKVYMEDVNAKYVKVSWDGEK